KLLLGLTVQANRQVDMLMIQARDHLAAAGADPGRMPKAEACLNQARQLAGAFGFDTQPIDARLASLRKPAPPAAPTAPPPVSPPAPVRGPQPLPAGPPGGQRGAGRLPQARMERRRGETGAARRLTVEAFNGNFGVQDEAQKVLRSVDAEEFNQRIAAA